MGIEATPKDYWIAPNAINITLNALGEANRIQGNASPGAVISCYMSDIAPGGKNGDGLQLDNGRNPKRWPLVISPTFFSTDTIKYVYAAIPRTSDIGTLAVIVFPSEKLDIYGTNASDVQIGSEDYFYVFLQAIISAPSGNPLEREWIHEIEWGSLGTYEDIIDLARSSDWYEYNELTQLVTFLKDIVMGPGSSFRNINLNNKSLTSVANDTTPIDSETAVVTPSYATKRFLRKDVSDTAQGLIRFLAGLKVGSGDYGIDGNGDMNARNALFETLSAQEAHFFNLIIDEVKSVGGQLVITPANCTIDAVEAVDGGWKCYFRASDGERAIVNEWAVGDQALHNEFNVESGDTRNYWRLVTAVSSEPVTKVVGELELDCHWVVLSSSDCKTGSAAPMAGDSLSQLGNRTDATRQRAIVVSAYNIPFIDTAPYMGQVGGIQAPLFASYKDIDSYTIGEVNRVNVIAANGNLFNGRMDIGSTLADGRPVNDLGTEDGNLLRNTYFGGDYESEPSDATVMMTADTPLWSDPLKHWEVTGEVSVTDYADAKSGRCAVLTEGQLSQSVAMEDGEWYMLSFHASGTSLTVSIGESGRTVVVGAGRTRYDIAFQGDGNDVSFSGTCILSDIILTRGTLPVEWERSPLDPTKEKALDISNEYLRHAISEASTSILGGLVLSQIIKVGNYRINEETGGYVFDEETGGMSGARNHDNSPYLWGGGTMEQAIHTIDKYKNDPTYTPTGEELENMAKFVVTHGGRAILNDIILRGYIYALGGHFEGDVEATSGIFKNITTPNGSFSIDDNGNVVISGISGLYEIRIDANTRQLSVWGPDKVVGPDDFTPVEGAEKVEYMNLGSFIHDGSQSVAPKIWMRRYQKINDDEYSFITTFDPFNGIVFSREIISGGHKTTVVEDILSPSGYSFGENWNGGNTASYVNLKNLPTDPTILPVGDLYNDNGILKIKQ